MATTNVTIDNDWEKVADASDANVTIQCLNNVPWEVAAIATDVAPTITGHRFYGGGQIVTRAMLGSGFIYARGRINGDVVLAISKWAQA